MLLVAIFFLPTVLALPAEKQVKIENLVVSGKCPDGTLESPNHACFKFINNSKTFFDAETSCVSLGGHLALIDILFTDTFVAREFVISEQL